jgi:hypothetical protein
MILANIEAQIEAKKKEILSNQNEIKKLNVIIKNNMETQNRLFKNDSKLCSELRDLEDEYEEEKENIGL